MLEVLVLLRMTNHKYSINTEKPGFLMYEIKKKKEIKDQLSTQETTTLLAQTRLKNMLVCCHLGLFFRVHPAGWEFFLSF